MKQALQVTATGDGVRVALDALDRFLRACGLAPEESWQLGVALDEVLSNVVRHGGATGRGTRVEVGFELLKGEVTVTVADDGPAFDPLSLPAPDIAAPIDARQPGGLGVHLTRQLVDKVAYERRGDMNCVAFSRRLAPAG